jgi:AcrR family transcriptional regulator
MPRIAADTVAEHRAHQHEAILDAAEVILLADGYEALNFRALGEQAGIARNSVYRYFTSCDDIVAALCERDMPRWLVEIESAMAAAPEFDDRIAAFVATQLRLVADGSHRLAEVLGAAPLGPGARARIQALAYGPSTVLEEELRTRGYATPEVTAQLVQGLVGAAVRMLHQGATLADVADETTAMALRLLAPGDDPA